MAAVNRALLLLLVFLFTIAASSALAKKEKPLTTVADLRYGVALYHYHQQEYLQALTELLIAKERGGIQGHGDNPALMEGGFALAYGLERYSASIFSEMLADNVPEKSQVAAWYYLAKMRYMRGDWAMAESSLAHVKAIGDSNKNSINALSNDLDILNINLAIKKNNREQAEAFLENSNLSDNALSYLYFNLGSLAAREQDFTTAIEYYNRIGKIEHSDDEFRALHDKAMTAAGYSFLLSGDYVSAMGRFSNVRVDSALSGRALLGYGWAATELQQYSEALKVWSHLSRASLADENSQEALVAMPYAYEKMGRDGLALQEFKKAEYSFKNEINRLDDVIANLSGDTLLQALRIENEDGIDWLTQSDTPQLAPQLSYLIALFSQEKFQLGIQELRALLGVQKNTVEWQQKLAFYSDMLQQREIDRDNKAAVIAQETLKNQINNIQRKRNDLALKIETIAGGKDYLALASGDEANLIRRAVRAKKAVSLPALREDDPFIEDTDEAVRWYYGMLLWNASENFSDRLWQAVKTLNSLDATIDELQSNYRNIEKILSAAPDLQPFRIRVAEANARLERQNIEVNRAVAASKEQLRQQVVSVLREQRLRVEHYLAQSRLSVARLYDKARLLQEQEAFAPNSPNVLSGEVDQ